MKALLIIVSLSILCSASIICAKGQGDPLSGNYTLKVEKDEKNEVLNIKFTVQNECTVKIDAMNEIGGDKISLVDSEMSEGTYVIHFKLTESFPEDKTKFNMKIFSLDDNSLVYTVKKDIAD